jgi:hypothetical protein
MKHILFLLFSLSIFAQDTIPASKSVIALDKMNVVYRGITNPISIAVNDAKSYKIYGNGVSKNEDGKYILAPGIGLTTKVYVEITKNDDSIVIEEHEFRIKGIPSALITLNNEFSTQLYLEFKLDDLKNAKLGILFLDLLIPFTPEVTQFCIKVPRYPTLKIQGNLFNDEVFQLLSKARKNDIILVSEIKGNYMTNNIQHKKINPLIFKIIK